MINHLFSLLVFKISSPGLADHGLQTTQDDIWHLKAKAKAFLPEKPLKQATAFFPQIDFRYIFLSNKEAALTYYLCTK